MEITMKQYDKVVTIEVEAEDLDIFEVKNELLKPALAALGYQDCTIKEIFIGEE